MLSLRLFFDIHDDKSLILGRIMNTPLHLLKKWIPNYTMILGYAKASGEAILSESETKPKTY